MNKPKPLRKNTLALIFSTIISLVVLELASMLLIKSGYLAANRPLYNWQSEYYYQDVNEVFGVWHKPNSSFKHIKSCFNCVYSFNEMGCRDQTRKRTSDKRRFFVIGDSFAEGYANQDKDRWSNLLEKRTGLEFLNFGTAGITGNLQELLIYQYFKDSLEHTDIIWLLFPQNDFDDDDLNFGQQFYADRYRPYLTGEYPNYSITYYQDALEKSKLNTQIAEPKTIRNFLRRFSYTFNAYLYVKYYQKLSKVHKEKKNINRLENYNDNEYQRMKYCIEELINIAKGKQITIVIVPALQELSTMTTGKTKLYTNLNALSKEIDFNIVDLSEGMRQIDEINTLYYQCDGHWNAKGNELAANLILPYLNLKTDGDE